MYNFHSDYLVGGLVIGLIFLVIIAIIILVAYLVFYLIGMYKLFKKLGKNGWEVFIPFYGKWVLFQAAGLEWYWFLIALAPTLFSIASGGFLSSIAYVAALISNLALIYNLSKKFHKSTAWLVVSFFFSGFTLPILGLSNKEVCDVSVVVTPNAMFDGQNNANKQGVSQPQTVIEQDKTEEITKSNEAKTENKENKTDQEDR